MAGIHAVGMVMLQMTEDGGRTAHDNHLGQIWLCVIALCMLAQAIGVCMVGAFAYKAFRKLTDITGTIETKTMPLVDKASAMIDELAPKIRTITINVEEVTYTVREQCTELSATLADLNRTVRDANVRTRAQVSRVDGLVTEALTTTEHVSKTVQEGIRTPVRHIAGVLAGAKAAVETLIARSPFPLKRHDVGDTEY